MVGLVWSLFGILSGAFIAVQAPINSQLARGLGLPVAAAAFSFLSGAIVLGIVAGVVCFIACSALKNALGYDDALDVFGVHCIGGIVGALGTGILAAPVLGGTGVVFLTIGQWLGGVLVYELGMRVSTAERGEAARMQREAWE